MCTPTLNKSLTKTDALSAYRTFAVHRTEGKFQCFTTESKNQAYSNLTGTCQCQLTGN